MLLGFGAKETLLSEGTPRDFLVSFSSHESHTLTFSSIPRCGRAAVLLEHC